MTRSHVSLSYGFHVRDNEKKRAREDDDGICNASWWLPKVLTSKVCQGTDGATTSFIDRGVYTKNRAFRLMLSSKAGKDTILQVTGHPLPFPLPSATPSCDSSQCIDFGIEGKCTNF